MATTATVAKDIAVANLIDYWNGASNSMSVFDFFYTVTRAAEMGRLNSKDKVHLVRLKLRGVARAFYLTQPSLKADDCTYEELRTAFINRFKDKHTDQYNYSRVQTASQERNESPEMFLDRFRKLCQCYSCGLSGHYANKFPRGQRNLNGIGRAMTTPSSNPK
jgi:hypothetical protein